MRPPYTAGPAYRPGLVLAALILCVYGGLGLTVDFPRAAIGIQSDEATYYMMGHSLAEDGDLTYRREDLVRVWREFPGGPTGVFLKKGRDIERFGLMLRPPFFWTQTRPDPDPNRYFYGKSFAYPLFAAPFVWLFGTNGFLLLNALLLSAATLCGYLFLQARSRPAVAAVLSGGFVMASVVPVYFVWIAPELFNFALGVFAYFCWLYKEVAAPSAAGRGTRWLFRSVERRDRGGDPRPGHVLEGLQCGAVPADRARGCCGGAAGGRRSPRRQRSASSRSACSRSTRRSPGSGAIKAESAAPSTSSSRCRPLPRGSTSARRNRATRR